MKIISGINLFLLMFTDKSQSAFDLVYFHSERGRRNESTHVLGLHSANLIDFFVEVCSQVPRALIVLPRAEGRTPVTLSYGHNTDILELPFPRSRSPLELSKVWKLIRRLMADPLLTYIRSAKYSVSIGLSFFGTMTALIRVYVAKRPHCFIVRGDRIKTVSKSSRSPLSKAILLFRLYLYRFILELLVRRGRAEVWFQGEMNHAAFQARLGVRYSRQLHVLNAVLRDLPVQRYEFSDRFNRSYDLVFVGHLNREKGVFDIVKAVRLIKEAGRELIVLVIGAGVDEHELRDYVIKNGLERNFNFLGYISDPVELARCISKAKLFILPSHTEGMPRAMVEAMFLGIPVLVTRVGGIPYVIDDGVTGLLVDPQDPEGLGQRIIEGLDAHLAGADEDMISAARELAFSMSFKNKVRFFLDRACAERY